MDNVAFTFLPCGSKRHNLLVHSSCLPLLDGIGFCYVLFCRYVCGYKNRYQNFIRYLRELGDEVRGLRCANFEVASKNQMLECLGIGECKKVCNIIALHK